MKSKQKSSYGVWHDLIRRKEGMKDCKKLFNVTTQSHSYKMINGEGERERHERIGMHTNIKKISKGQDERHTQKR